MPPPTRRPPLPPSIPPYSSSLASQLTLLSTLLLAPLHSASASMEASGSEPPFLLSAVYGLAGCFGFNPSDPASLALCDSPNPPIPNNIVLGICGRLLNPNELVTQHSPLPLLGG